MAKTVTTITSGGNFRNPVGVAIGKLNPLALLPPLGQVKYTRDTALALCAGPTYTVPLGVTRVRFEVIGDHGVDGGQSGTQSTGGSGGFGGRVIGDLSVTPGQRLYMNVGRNGSGGLGGSRGARGGDSSWISTDPSSQTSTGSGRTCGAGNFQVLAAGGGGGGQSHNGSGGTGGEADARGSDGGDDSATLGADYGNGGEPGTQTAGGAGGQKRGSGTAGAAGAFQFGGVGGRGFEDLTGGGGGGGGFYGGGGGGSGSSGGGGGGGGGSSYIRPGFVTSGYAGVARTRFDPPSITLTPIG